MKRFIMLWLAVICVIMTAYGADTVVSENMTQEAPQEDEMIEETENQKTEEDSEAMYTYETKEFHGTEDDLVDITYSEQTVDLKKCVVNKTWQMWIG